MSDAGILGEDIEGLLETLFDVHAARPAGLFGDPVEKSGKVLFGVG
jgi:hypothetical protein